MVTPNSFWLGDRDRETYKYDVDSNTWVKEEQDSSLSRSLFTLGKFVVDILAAGGPFLIVLVRSLSLSISPVTKKSFQILLGIIIYFMLNKWFFLVINKNVLICVAAVSLLLSVVPSLKRNRIGNPVAPLSQDRLIGKQKFLNQRQFWFVSPQSVCSWPLMEIHLSRETELIPATSLGNNQNQNHQQFFMCESVQFQFSAPGDPFTQTLDIVNENEKLKTYVYTLNAFLTVLLQSRRKKKKHLQPSFHVL